MAQSVFPFWLTIQSVLAGFPVFASDNDHLRISIEQHWRSDQCVLYSVHNNQLHEALWEVLSRAVSFFSHIPAPQSSHRHNKHDSQPVHWLHHILASANYSNLYDEVCVNVCNSDTKQQRFANSRLRRVQSFNSPPNSVVCDSACGSARTHRVSQQSEQPMDVWFWVNRYNLMSYHLWTSAAADMPHANNRWKSEYLPSLQIPGDLLLLALKWTTNLD